MRWRWLRDSTPLAWGLAVAAAAFLLMSMMVLAQATPEQPTTEAVRRAVDVRLDQDETLRITYLGDSLTAGMHAITEQDAYRSRLTSAVAAGGPVEESGSRIVGGTVRQTLEGNDQLPNAQHLYIVELGTNDINEVDHRIFSEQYEQLLARVRESSPDAALVCLGTWRPPSRGANHDLVIRQACESFGGQYRRLADLEADPTHKGPAGVETFLGPSDDFHPNNAGHAAIFERALSAIEVRRAG